MPLTCSDTRALDPLHLHGTMCTCVCSLAASRSHACTLVLCTSSCVSQPQVVLLPMRLRLCQPRAPNGRTPLASTDIHNTCTDTCPGCSLPHAVQGLSGALHVPGDCKLPGGRARDCADSGWQNLSNNLTGLVSLCMVQCLIGGNRPRGGRNRAAYDVVFKEERTE